MVTTNLQRGAMLILLFGSTLTIAGKGDEPRLDESKHVRKDRYGDPLPVGALSRLGTVRLRHTCGISPVGFTLDSKRAIVGDRDGNLVWWDVASGKEVRRLKQSPGITSLAISPDGKTLAVGNPEGYLFLLDLATGKRLSPVELRILHERIQHILFAPDGRTLALGGYKTIVLWDAVHQKQRHELKGHSGGANYMAFGADGRTLVSADPSDLDIHLWDVATGKEKARLHGDKGHAWGLAVSPDGKTLAVIDDSSWHLVFYDADSSKKLRTVEDCFFGISSLRYAPDGKTLAINDYGTVRILDAFSGRRLRTFAGQTWGGLAFSPDGKTLATFFPGGNSHSFHLWDVAGGKLRHSFAGHTESVTGLAFAANGKTLFSVEDEGELLAWDAATSELRGRFCDENEGHSYRTLALSADGKVLAAGGCSGLQLWNPTTRKMVRNCAGGAIQHVHSLTWSADGRTLVTGGSASAIFHVWDAPTGKERRAIDAKQDIPDQHGAVALSPHGEIVAVGAYGDGTIRLWSAATGKEVRRMVTPPIERIDELRGGRRLIFSPLVEALTFSPDGSVLASIAGRMIYLWDPATGRLLHQWDTEETRIEALAFSTDGRTLVTGHNDHFGRNDHSMRLWEVATGKQRACFFGHRAAVTAVAIARDGRRVASGSEDTTILVWDATGGARSDAVLSAKQLQTLWADLIRSDAGRAYRAVWQIALAPRQSLPFLEKQLRRLTRLNAEQQEKIARLIADLEDDQFAVREKATRELEGMESWVEPALHKALQSKPSLEVRLRIEKVLEKVAGWSGERLRALRTLEAIEHMNTPKARRLLEALSASAPRTWFTEEARAICKRLAEQPITAPER